MLDVNDVINIAGTVYEKVSKEKKEYHSANSMYFVYRRDDATLGAAARRRGGADTGFRISIFSARMRSYRAEPKRNTPRIGRPTSTELNQ